jgi:hypothetical protein
MAEHDPAFHPVALLSGPINRDVEACSFVGQHAIWRATGTIGRYSSSALGLRDSLPSAAPLPDFDRLAQAKVVPDEPVPQHHSAPG